MVSKLIVFGIILSIITGISLISYGMFNILTSDIYDNIESNLSNFEQETYPISLFENQKKLYQLEYPLKLIQMIQ